MVEVWRRRRRMSYRQWLWRTGALLAVALVTWSAREFHRPEQIQVTTASVRPGRIARPTVATGTLEAIPTVPIGAQVSGTIQTLAADYNSVVHAGQVIATLDPSLFAAAQREAQAELGEAQAAANRAEADAR